MLHLSIIFSRENLIPLSAVPICTPSLDAFMESHYVAVLQLLPNFGLFPDQLQLPRRHPCCGDDLGGKLLAGDLVQAPLDGAEGALPELLLELVVVGEVVVALAIVDFDRDHPRSTGLTRHRHRLPPD